MAKKRTFDELTEEVINTFKSYTKTGTPEWDRTTAARDLPYQVGSLTKALMQLDGIRFREGKTDNELKKIIADELADILSLVLFIAHEEGISLERAFDDMLFSDQRKITERS